MTKKKRYNYITYSKGFIVDFASYWKWFSKEEKADKFANWAGRVWPRVVVYNCAEEPQTRCNSHMNREV